MTRPGSRALGLALFGAALALLWHFRAAWHWPGATALTLGVAGMALSYVLRAARLRAEWQDDLLLSWPDCLRLTLWHSAAVNWLPMRAGDLGYPWLLRQRWGVSLASAACSLLWLRLQDAAILLWLAALAWALWAPVPPLQAGAPLLALSLLLGLVLLRGAGWARRAAARGRWAGVLARAALRNRRATWLWALANWATKLAALGALLAALADSPIGSGWVGALAGELAAALPVQAPAGFGSYEAAVAAALSALNAAEFRAALAAALALHLFVMALSALGALLALLGEPSAPRLLAQAR